MLCFWWWWEPSRSACCTRPLDWNTACHLLFREMQASIGLKTSLQRSLELPLSNRGGADYLIYGPRNIQALVNLFCGLWRVKRANSVKPLLSCGAKSRHEHRLLLFQCHRKLGSKQVIDSYSAHFQIPPFYLKTQPSVLQVNSQWVFNIDELVRSSNSVKHALVLVYFWVDWALLA